MKLMEMCTALNSPIKHSNIMVIETAFGSFGTVGRSQTLLEYEINIWFAGF